MKNKSSSPTAAEVPLLTEEVEENAIEDEKPRDPAPSTFREGGKYNPSQGTDSRDEYDEKMIPESRSPTSPTSPAAWSSAADAPLLSDMDEQGAEGEKAVEVPKEEKKPSFDGAEYKIAFSHFVVRSCPFQRNLVNTEKSDRGYFPTPREMINGSSWLQYALPSAPESLFRS